MFIYEVSLTQEQILKLPLIAVFLEVILGLQLCQLTEKEDLHFSTGSCIS